MQHDAPYTLAQDALDLAELREGARSVPAACRCGNDLGGRMLLIRDRDEIDSEPYDAVIEDDGTGDGPSVLGSCWDCDADVSADVVVLRDRRRRCVRLMAAEGAA